MPYPNEHSCRLHDPKNYDEFRRQNDKFGSGIHAIFGIVTKPKRVSELQAIRFSKSKHTVAEAKKWCKDHDHNCIRFEPATGKAKVLPISGVIGWDVEAKDIRTFLNDSKGEDIEVQISSPGGYIYPGLEMFNLLRNHDGKVTTRLMGLAASMASYLAMAGDYVIAEDNAVFMIHNAQGFAMGDHNTMRKAADVMEGLTNLLAQKYMSKTGKSLKELKALMDVDTFLYGDEITDAGFADEIAETEEGKDKAAALALAVISIADCTTRMKASEEKPEDIEKAAALLNEIKGGETKTQGAWKYCVCDKCGHWEKHVAGKPCGKCPKCKAQMHGADKKPKGVRGMKTLKEILAIEDVEERKAELDKFFAELFDADQEAMVKEALMSIEEHATDETLKQTIEALEKKLEEVKAAKTPKADESLMATIQTLQDEVQGLRTDLEASQKVTETEREARRMLEIKNSLKDLELIGDLEKMTKTIFMLENISAEAAQDMIDQFKETSEKLKAAGIFTEVGSGSDGAAGSAYAKLKKLVEAKLSEDSNITPAKAWKNVIRDNPETYKEYLKER
ncbi:ATP-dependent Clp protease proteolytic subunit [Candidatus Babeliales bacterium]|nr:ATP-dependent Clp protease proteolytic subunit [Candidatus Babeliales bacterium]